MIVEDAKSPREITECLSSGKVSTFSAEQFGVTRWGADAVWKEFPLVPLALIGVDLFAVRD